MSAAIFISSVVGFGICSTEVGSWGYALNQRSPTGCPRENFGGPWRNLDIICNFYVYYTYFKQAAATNITLIILL
jgi:hypothetical protein